MAERDDHRDNLDHWEKLAAFHGTGQDRYYDLDALAAGHKALRGPELEAVALATNGSGVAGRRIAHVQSHIGIDSVLLARMGAEVTAFDFSPTALRKLAEIARRCDVQIATVQADSRALANDEYADHHGSFDVVYATVGVLGWISDIDDWMRGAAALLRPGGQLALVELHPLLCMPETTTPLVMDYPYVNDGGRHYVGTGSYANPDADIAWAVDQYAWSIGEVVNAAIDAGLVIARLIEHVEAPFDPRGDLLTPEEDGMYRWRLGTGPEGSPAEALPVLFTLIAEKVP
jgi:SAM-dependent methyltransferase